MKLVMSNMPEQVSADVSRYRDTHGHWVTVCNLYDQEHMVGHGVAVCGNSDRFKPDMGKHIAVGRAMKAAGMRNLEDNA